LTNFGSTLNHGFLRKLKRKSGRVRSFGPSFPSKEDIDSKNKVYSGPPSNLLPDGLSKLKLSQSVPSPDFHP
jgi:hypothetical protein